MERGRRVRRDEWFHQGAARTATVMAAMAMACAGCGPPKHIVVKGEEKKPEPVGLECAGELGDSPSLRRLTQVEFNNTVRDLLGAADNPANGFAPDPEVSGFRNNSSALSVTQLLASQLFTTTDELARATVSRRLDKVLRCNIGTPECTAQFIQEFGRRAYRRPLTGAEQASLLIVFNGGEGFVDGVRLVIQRVLLSPHFLYRREAGEPGAVPAGPSGVVPLSQYEIASRLSYFLLQTMPDDALLAEADAGRLDTRERIAAQARRLLDDPRARLMVDDFHDQWLGIGKVNLVAKDADRFPDFTPDIRRDMADEARLFAGDVFWSGSDARTLLTGTETFLTAALANYYGAPREPGIGFTRGVLPLGQERAGLLSLGAITATNSYADQISPVHRGKFVRNRLLCQELAPPPPDVNATPPPASDSDSLRERWSAHSSNEACAGCHRQTDPIGFGTSNFDAAGRWQAMDHGAPIDASGEIAGFDGGNFNGIAELGKKLSESQGVRFCIALQWLRFALGRLELPEDLCTVDKLVEKFSSGGLSLRELVVALVQSDAFRYRRLVVPAPDSGGGAP